MEHLQERLLILGLLNGNIEKYPCKDHFFFYENTQIKTINALSFKEKYPCKDEKLFVFLQKNSFDFLQQ